MRIGVVIVSFNPDEKLLITLDEITQQNVEIVVIDNSPNENIIIEKVLKKYKKESVFVIKNNENIGLAKAQNMGIKKHLSNKIDYICFFDQDSVVPMNYFLIMREEIINLQKKNIKLGAIGPNFIDRNLKMGARYAKLNKIGYESKSFDKSDNDMLEVTFLISSGSIIPSNVIRELGEFKSDFFIDQIDTEYSMRILSNGYKSYATSSVSLDHTIGDRSLESLLGITIKPNHHNSLRKFLIFRNGMQVMKEYGRRYPAFVNLMLQRFIHDILGIIFFEKNKAKKIKAVIYGIYEGMKPLEKWRKIDGLFSEKK